MCFYVLLPNSMRLGELVASLFLRLHLAFICLFCQCLCSTVLGGVCVSPAFRLYSPPNLYWNILRSLIQFVSICLLPFLLVGRYPKYLESAALDLNAPCWTSVTLRVVHIFTEIWNFLRAVLRLWAATTATTSLVRRLGLIYFSSSSLISEVADGSVVNSSVCSSFIVWSNAYSIGSSGGVSVHRLYASEQVNAIQPSEALRRAIA